MQNFAAPFEPESLPAVGLTDWLGLLAAPLLQQLGESREALVQTVTEETVAAGA
jgi:hypothetical protein